MYDDVFLGELRISPLLLAASMIAVSVLSYYEPQSVCERIDEKYSKCKILCNMLEDIFAVLNLCFESTALLLFVLVHRYVKIQHCTVLHFKNSKSLF